MCAATQQVTEFAAIPLCSDIGILLVDSRGLKQRLVPSPKHNLERMQKLLPQLVRLLSLRSASSASFRRMWCVWGCAEISES